ncbi:STAS domain-containing protein [Tropicibacter oceani]|uniref:Anti-sigma factor antagonist n=1 Tax=Tropicibacter oceani TaxID=3058420 RepID=A0ABY8QJ43_9RHOB|nr:STAS domain-containing protein [Tropicibacter oceani]WGW04011.1 STAS domain-containing protein [Tropicibacter oceani]
MKLTTQPRGDIDIVNVEANRIDAAVAIQFKDRMREAVADASGRVILNLEHVDFIDSSGLGAIVAAMKLMPDGRKLELAGLTPTVDKVFRMTRMDSIFTIHDSVDLAVQYPA